MKCQIEFSITLEMCGRKKKIVEYIFHLKLSSFQKTGPFLFKFLFLDNDGFFPFFSNQVYISSIQSKDHQPAGSLITISTSAEYSPHVLRIFRQYSVCSLRLLVFSQPLITCYLSMVKWTQHCDKDSCLLQLITIHFVLITGSWNLSKAT